MGGEFALGPSTECSVIHEVASAITDGSLFFYDYKNFHSIVLLALVDANYSCLLYDLGAPGRGSDAGVFGNSSVKSFLEGHFDDFPGPVQLPNVGKVKHHILVDQGFRQTIRFIRPFISADSISDIKKAYFNKNLSGARRVVENYFGILSTRFRMYTKPIYAGPDKVKNIVLATMILHNLLVEAVGGDEAARRYLPSNMTAEYEQQFESGNISNEAKIARETVMN
ncbi:hypothetical protein Aduo_018556 [Ancylostoma duodenale]